MERPRVDRILADWDMVSRQASRPGLPPHRPVTTALPVATITGAALLLVVVVAAGLWFGLPPGVGQPEAQMSPSPEPSASPLEPSASPVKTWGPLAVAPPQDGTDLARNEGTLRITDSCVYLESQGELTLLTWPADRTTWNGESRTITFENFDAAFDGSVVTVRDGDYVVLGGGGDSAAESGVSGEEWVRRMDWVAPPASSCLLDPRFGVGAVELTTDDPVWGPLAVVEVTGADALIRGTLRVTGECVFLQAQGQDVLLVWPAGPTTWNPEDRTVRFARTDGSVVVMRTGDEVSLGGGGSTEAEDGLSREEWARRIDWIAPPAAACLTHTRFFVSDVP